MLPKQEVVEDACSQFNLADPLRGSRAAATYTDNQELNYQFTRTVSGHKRSVPAPANAAAENRHPSQRACRELFRSNHEQAGPSAQPQPGLHPSAEACAPTQATPAPVPQPPVMLCAPVADPWSLLLFNSGQVLHNRLSSSSLVSSTTATGQQLLQLEIQLQALLGIRRDEEGSDNVCWVDHGLLHYSHGILQFCRVYGDAECAQVSNAWPVVISNHETLCDKNVLSASTLLHCGQQARSATLSTHLC